MPRHVNNLTCIKCHNRKILRTFCVKWSHMNHTLHLTTGSYLVSYKETASLLSLAVLHWQVILHTGNFFICKENGPTRLTLITNDTCISKMLNTNVISTNYQLISERSLILTYCKTICNTTHSKE